MVNVTGERSWKVRMSIPVRNICFLRVGRNEGWVRRAWRWNQFFWEKSWPALLTGGVKEAYGVWRSNCWNNGDTTAPGSCYVWDFQLLQYLEKDGAAKDQVKKALLRIGRQEKALNKLIVLFFFGLGFTV